MIIKVGKWEVESKTFIRLERHKAFPKLILHEKFEGKVKWTLRILTLIGIGTSLVSLAPLSSLFISIALVLIDLFLEKILFEYTVFILPPFTDFEIDYNQWLTNGYLFPVPGDNGNFEQCIHFGPAYNSKVYAIKFFSYLKSWNQGNFDDTENNICLSFVLEDNNSYSTYLYANPKRKWLDTVFHQYRVEMKHENYGKTQQSLVMQMIYWKNLALHEASLFSKFLQDQPQNGKFYFLPFYIVNEQPIPILELKITKYQYQIKHRKDLTKNDVEYYHK